MMYQEKIEITRSGVMAGIAAVALSLGAIKQLQDNPYPNQPFLDLIEEFTRTALNADSKAQVEETITEFLGPSR